MVGVNGRPLKYKTPEAMQADVDAYFESLKHPSDKALDRKPTVSGLGLALGMTTESLRNYAERDGFFAIIKAAKQKIELALEEHLYGQSVTGAIFNLKCNFGYRDTDPAPQTVINNISGGSGKSVAEMSKEELEAELAAVEQNS